MDRVLGLCPTDEVPIMDAQDKLLYQKLLMDFLDKKNLRGLFLQYRELSQIDLESTPENLENLVELQASKHIHLMRAQISAPSGVSMARVPPTDGVSMVCVPPVPPRSVPPPPLPVSVHGVSMARVPPTAGVSIARVPHVPPRSVPPPPPMSALVERLTFEEFFNHPFLSEKQPQEPLRVPSSRDRDGFRIAESNLGKYAEESSQEDCLPFLLDDDSSGPDGSPSFPAKRASTRYNTNVHKLEHTGSRLDHHKSSEVKLKEPINNLDQRSAKASSRVVDSLELIDQDYVLVSAPPLEVPSSSMNASRPHHLSFKLVSSPAASLNKSSVVTAPMSIVGAPIRTTCGFGSLESQSSAPSATSQGSVDMGDALEQSPTHSVMRIRSLQLCASAIVELVNEKIEVGKQLEAFSIQLIILAIWKQALHICHTQAASAIEGSLTRETNRVRGSTDKMQGSLDIQNSLSNVATHGPEAICSQIEKEFLIEVGHAEDLASGLEPNDGSTAMPDAMESIFQSALGLGRCGAVDELLGNMDSAVSLYSKAVRLFGFLLVEAPSLILKPPFSLTSSDRFRLRTYIDVLNIRQDHSRSQRMALLKCEDQQLTH